MTFLLSILNIAISDLVLAADNAVVIAMMALSLPEAQRRRGIIGGALAAVILRIILTFGVAQLLTLAGLKFIGGAMIVWIAWKVLTTDVQTETHTVQPAGMIRAILMILMADITMSLDNVLAVAAASHGNFMLLILGLGLSIPMVMFASDSISKIMKRWPIITWIGSAVLARVGTELMLSDPWTQSWLLSEHQIWAAQAAMVVAVLGIAGLAQRHK